MPNHVHFISIPQEPDSLAKTFNTCHMRCSQYYNKRKKTTGHLWQGRFYSCALDNNHLYEAVRYVENNPVRAKLIPKSEDWMWSSARTHLYNTTGFLDLDDISKYIKVLDWKPYLNERIDENVTKNIKANTLTGRASGNDSFVEDIERMFGKRLRPLPEGRPRKNI